jgi:hypothetical protein
MPQLNIKIPDVEFVQNRTNELSFCFKALRVKDPDVARPLY